MAVEVGDTISFEVSKDILGDLLEGHDLSLQDDNHGDGTIGVEVIEIIPLDDSLQITGVVQWVKDE